MTTYTKDALCQAMEEGKAIVTGFDDEGKPIENLTPDGHLIEVKKELSPYSWKGRFDPAMTARIENRNTWGKLTENLMQADHIAGAVCKDSADLTQTLKSSFEGWWEGFEDCTEAVEDTHDEALMQKESKVGDIIKLGNRTLCVVKVDGGCIECDDVTVHGTATGRMPPKDEEIFEDAWFDEFKEWEYHKPDPHSEVFARTFNTTWNSDVLIEEDDEIR